jgi:hypothetical protein
MTTTMIVVVEIETGSYCPAAPDYAPAFNPASARARTPSGAESELSYKKEYYLMAGIKLQLNYLANRAGL